MKIRCLFESHSDLPESSDARRYFPNSILHITKGKEYVVYGVLGVRLLPTSNIEHEYIILNDLDSFISYDVGLFEIVDSNLGDCQWHCGFGTKHVEFLLASKDFVNDISHYEGMWDREEADMEKFRRWAETVDTAHKTID